MVRDYGGKGRVMPMRKGNDDNNCKGRTGKDSGDDSSSGIGRGFVAGHIGIRSILGQGSTSGIIRAREADPYPGV